MYEGEAEQGEILSDIEELLYRKAQEYGGDNSRLVPDILVALYGGCPNHRNLDDYPVVVRVIEKLLRIARGSGNMTDAWMDIAGLSVRRLVHMKSEGEYEP